MTQTPSHLSPAVQQALLAAQRNELTEAGIYTRLAAHTKDAHNRQVLERIAADEQSHHDFYLSLTGERVRPHRFRAWWFYLIGRVLGLTFGIKLMERGEVQAQRTYEQVESEVPQVRRIIEDEDRHEHELIAMLDEDLLKYVGSIVLGLNDALVELTGALAGFTLALADRRLIAVAGLITGVAASLSMGASEYLSIKTEGGESPLRASVYTTLAYVCTVFLLVSPYLVLEDLYLCLGAALLNAILVILVFTYYISVAQDLSFRARFGEMAAISMCVAAVTFGIGFVIRHFLGMDA